MTNYVKDENNLPFIKRELKKLERNEIIAGIPLDDEELQEIATSNELGVEAKHVPPRPFIRYSFDTGKEVWQKDLENGIWNIFKGTGSAKLTQAAVGKVMVGTIKKAIIDWKVPPNAALTIALKGFNDPLIDTGHMRDSITYTVRKNEQEE